jgi:hypothetical protein
MKTVMKDHYHRFDVVLDKVGVQSSAFCGPLPAVVLRPCVLGGSQCLPRNTQKRMVVRQEHMGLDNVGSMNVLMRKAMEVDLKVRCDCGQLEAVLPSY